MTDAACDKLLELSRRWVIAIFTRLACFRPAAHDGTSSAEQVIRMGCCRAAGIQNPRPSFPLLSIARIKGAIRIPRACGHRIQTRFNFIKTSIANITSALPAPERQFGRAEQRKRISPALPLDRRVGNDGTPQSAHPPLRWFRVDTPQMFQRCHRAEEKTAQMSRCGRDQCKG